MSNADDNLDQMMKEMDNNKQNDIKTISGPINNSDLDANYLCGETME